MLQNTLSTDTDFVRAEMDYMYVRVAMLLVQVLTNFLSFSRCSVKPGSCLAWLNVAFANCTKWFTRDAPAEFAIE